MTSTARRMFELVEPIGVVPYSADEPNEAMFALGFTNYWDTYFAGRAAPLGLVPAEVVDALFYNFAPGEVARHIPKVWRTTTPEAAIAARQMGCVKALRRVLGDEVDAPAFARAADLLLEAATSAPFEGRPMYAALRSIPIPDEVVARLFHAASLLREHRGDGHIAALLLEGLTGLEALVTHAASGDVPADVLRTSRAWSPEEWSTGVDALRSRGVIAAGDAIEFTDLGAAMRQRMEDATDAASAPAYDVLGEDGCARLRELGRPLSLQIIESGLLRTDPSRYIDDR